MKYTIENPPAGLKQYRKIYPIKAVLMTEPFTVMTQEGEMNLSPETVDDWDQGYYLVYPTDGGKPYSCSAKTLRKTYVLDED